MKVIGKIEIKSVNKKDRKPKSNKKFPIYEPTCSRTLKFIVDKFNNDEMIMNLVAENKRLSGIIKEQEDYIAEFENHTLISNTKKKIKRLNKIVHEMYLLLKQNKIKYNPYDEKLHNMD